MTDIRGRASELLQEGRDALKPTQADQMRILDGLRARLGDAVVLGETAPVAAAAAPSIVPVVSAVVVALGLAGGVLWFVLRGGSEEAQPVAVVPAAPSTAAPAPVAPAPLALAEEPAPAPAPAPAPVEREPDASPRSSPSGRTSTLAQEVALMSKATASLRAGRSAEALRTLEEHQRKFPGGVLAEERLAARVQALCSLGRHTQAAADLERLASTSPRSPQVVRARQVCDAKP